MTWAASVRFLKAPKASPYPLQDLVIQNVCYEVVFGHRDE